MKNLNFIVNRICANTPPCGFRGASHVLGLVLVLLTFGVGNAWGTPTTYNFSSIPTKGWSTSGGSQTINGKSWTYSSSTYIGNSSSRIQVGSQNSPQTSNWTIQTAISNFGANKKITAVAITAYTTVTTATYNISVGGSSVKSGSLTTSSATYTASSLNATSGNIVITLKGSSSSKAMYLSNIAVTYDDNSGPTLYTVTYDANGGSVTPASATQASAGAAITTPTPTRTGYTCSGWYTAASGGTKRCNAGGSYTPTATETIHAQWTPNNYSVNWVVNGNTWTGSTHGNPSTSVLAGNKVATLPTAPTSSACDNSKVFVGWTATENYSNASTPPTDLFITAAGAPTVTANVTYYAVFATNATNATRVTATSGIVSGNYYVFVNDQKTNGTRLFKKDLTVGTTVPSESSSKITTISDCWLITGDNSSNGFTIASSSNKTLGVSGTFSNSKAISNTADNSKWLFNTSTTNYLRIYNKASTSYNIEYSGSSWVVYGSTSGDYVKMKVYKLNYTNFATTCCQPLGTINGSISLTQLDTPDPTKLKATWMMNATTGIASYDLEVYNSSNVKVKTINNYTSGSEITGLAPCTTYYVKLYTVSSGGSYCDGGLISTSSTCTTNSYSVNYDGCSGVTHSGATTVCASSDFSVTFNTASPAYVLPDNISVTIGGNTATAGTDYTWTKATGILTIAAAKQTGNIVIDVDGILVGCTNDPTVTNEVLGLNGSGTFSLSQVDVTTSGWSTGSNTCEWSDYGFVWGTSANPTVSDNKVPVGNSGSAASWNGSLTGDFSTGVTYHYRAYAKNSKTGAEYLYSSTEGTFTPYTVSYNKNDNSATGEVATVVVNAGGSVTLPDASAFTLNCNDLTKWALNSASGTQYDPEDTYSSINANAEFYAIWNTRTYTISYAAGNTPLTGAEISGSKADQTKTCGVSFTLPDVIFTVTGYTQKGWKKTIDGTSKTNNLNGTYNPSEANEKDQTFYPYWEINTYNVTKGTATGCSGDYFTVASTATHGSSVTVTASPDNAHKGSAQVSVSPSGNATVSGTTISNITGDIEVSVSFAAKETASIILHDAGGQSTVSGTHYEMDNYTLPNTAAACTESEFYGWYTEAYSSESTAPSGDKYIAKNASKALVAGENHFYAVYAAVTPDAANTYKKITSTSELVTGDYLIAGQISDYYGMKNSYYSVNSTMNDASLTVSDGVASNPDATQIWRITKSINTITICSSNDGKYFGFTSNHVALLDEAQELTYEVSEGKWAIYAGSDYLKYASYFQRGTEKVYQAHLFKRDPLVAGPYTTSPKCTTHDLSYADPGTEGTVVLGKETLVEGKTTTAIATPSEHYTFSHWTITGTGAGLSIANDNPVTVTMGTTDAVLTAHFTEKEKCTVEFYNNGGSALSSTTYWLGETPTAPTLTDGHDHDACDENSTAHYGWTRTALASTVATQAEIDELDGDAAVYAKADGVPAIAAGDNGKTIKYYAVWAHATDNSVSKDYILTINRSAVPASYAGAWSAKDASEDGGSDEVSVELDGSDVMQSTAQGHTTHIQFKSSTGNFYNTENLGSITSISTGNNSIGYHIGNSAQPTGDGSGGYFKIYNTTSSAQYTATITINFTKTVGDITYSAFLTNCCNQLEDINGEVEFTDPTTAVVTWDKLENVANAYVVSYRTGEAAYGTTNVSEVDLTGSKATCTITGLSCNTNYDFKIAVTAATGYCDKEQVIEGQNSGKYAIALNGNGTVTGGTFEADATDACDDATITLSADKSTGYNFSSWAISDGSSNITADVLKDGYEATDEIVEITMPAKDITVNASFSAISYTILYENMDGATNHVSNPSSYTVEDAISLGDPTKEGFNFGGWFINSDLAAGHEAGSPAIEAGSTGNKTFYAKWIADDKWSVAITAPSHGTITVSWNDNANSFSEGAQNIDKNTDIIITATPSAGYELTSLKIGDADFVSGNTHKLTSSIVISATFSIINYTISYENMEGATNHQDNVTSYTIESEDVYLYEASKTGYTFGGWFTDNNVWENEVIAIEHGSTGNVVVYAKWTAKQSTITWDANGGSVDPTSSSYTYDGDAVELPIPTREHYTFDGWFTAAEGGTQITVIGTENKPEADVTYHAHWTEITYTVKWSVNADDTYAEGDPTTSVTYNSKVTTLPTAPTSAECDDAKKFVGWRAEKITGTSADKPSGVIFKDVEHSPAITEDVTFYAVFADVTGGESITLDFPDDNNENNHVGSYTDTWTATKGGYSWSISNFNNNSWNQNWAYIKCGRKSNASTGKITTSNAIGFTVDSVLVNIGSITAGNVNSAKLYISSASTFATKTSMDIDQSTGTKKLVIANPAENMYYQIEYDCSSASSNGVVQINSITYKQKVDTANYVTKCASCDADATFTTALPAVSAEDCTSATVTATGGLATLGSEGCNISDYGFVLGTATDPVLNGEGVTKLQVGTSNPTTGEDFSHNITGLTAATHYYVRAYAINRHGTAYSSTKDFWTNGVSSIAVTHAPSKTNYIVGETFDATGMEVTATLAGGATDDVTADVTYSSSALTAGTSQNFTINYSLCGTEVGVNQTINVYTLTVTEGDNPSYGTASNTSANIVSVTGLGDHKTYTLTVTSGNATAVDNGDNTWSITNPSGDVTVRVDYKDAAQVDVYYKVNGETVLTQKVWESETTTLPNAADVTTALGEAASKYPNFAGWSETEFGYQTSEPTLVTGTPTINASKTFHAVFTNVNKVRIDGSVITSNGYPSNEANLSVNNINFKYHNILRGGNSTDGYYLQLRWNSTPYGYIYNSDEIVNITRIVSANYRISVYACTMAGTTTGSAITAEAREETDPYVYMLPANTSYFKLATEKDVQCKTDYIDIYYAPEAIYYTTQFQTLTFNKLNEATEDKSEIVAKNKAYTLTANNAPTEVEHYTFLDKWTDSQNTYEIGDAVTMSTNVTLTPISAYETTGDTDIDGLPESVTEIVVNVSKELNVNDDRTINTLTIKSTSGAFEVDGTSGQLTGSNTLTVTDNLFLEIKLRDGDMDAEASRKWYCIAAPFDVAINGGFFWGDGTPMVLNTHFQLFEWDGDRRASGASGWRRTSGIMKKDTAYFIGFDDERIGDEPGMNQNTIKLKAMNNTISNRAKIVAPEHTGSAEAATYGNWNGLANPNFHHIALNKNVQAFDYNKQGYSPYATGEYNFVVGTPFFIQYKGDIAIEAADNAYYRAPKREDEKYSYSVRIGSADASRADNRIIVRASENASAEFDNEHDMITLNNTTSNYGALLWTENYGGKRLAIEEAPLVNGTASYVLTLSAPQAGTYSISVAAPKENADLYLTYEGSIIWNLSMGEYTLDLNKGITNGYGLILVQKMPMTPTGIEDVQGDNVQCTKVVIDDHVYILRGGQMYDVTGKAVK